MLQCERATRERRETRREARTEVRSRKARRENFDAALFLLAAN